MLANKSIGRTIDIWFDSEAFLAHFFSSVLRETVMKDSSENDILFTDSLIKVKLEAKEEEIQAEKDIKNAEKLLNRQRELRLSKKFHF